MPWAVENENSGNTTDISTMILHDVETMLSQLSLAEKVSLLAGVGACSTATIPRLSIPRLEVRSKGFVSAVTTSSKTGHRLPTDLMGCVAAEAASLTR